MNAQVILISIDDAAFLLNTTPRRLKRLVQQGRVPVIDLGDGEPRFAPDHLRAWVESLKQQTKIASDAK